MYLLDTNALSELLKKRPKPQFLTRLRRHPPEMFFTSSICVMEYQPCCDTPPRVALPGVLLGTSSVQSYGMR